MTKLKRTASDDADFQKLVHLLDKDLEIRDGKEHSFYAQFNKIDKIRNAVVYYEEGIAVGCGAFKEFDNKTVEIKRMFVHPNFRSKGVGAVILKELELWASEINYSESVLETGKKQPEAIRLYQKSGYAVIPNFGQYKNVENSVCMKKLIK
ncbi:MAG TPA: GNAT family N-acetyltransferase [Bacteroidia bacterium]|nr:GNAT family N-acetyltransferase [Bacteroidia bacterium]